MLFIPCKHLCTILILMLYFSITWWIPFFIIMFLGHCHLGIAFCYPEWSYLNCFNMFLFSFCKKNKKKAPLAHLITRVVGKTRAGSARCNGVCHLWRWCFSLCGNFKKFQESDKQLKLQQHAVLGVHFYSIISIIIKRETSSEDKNKLISTVRSRFSLVCCK